MEKNQSPKASMGVRLRLTVALPAILTLLTFGSGVFAINLSKLILFDPFGKLRPPPFHLNQLYLWVAGYALVSGMLGFVFAYFLLSRPLRKSLRTIEDFLPEGASSRVEEAETETTLVAQTLTSLYPTLGRLRMAQSLLDALQSGVLWVAEEEKVVYVNQKALRIFGVAFDTLQTLPAMNLQVLLTEFEDASQFIHVVEDGLRREQYVSSKVIELFPSGKKGAFKIGVTSSPIFGSRGEKGVLLSFREVSEIRKVEKDLDQLDRLSTIGRLAAGLVHEIRNPLGSIMGLLELLREEPVAQEGEVGEYVERIYQASSRIQKILSEVLDFAGPSDISFQRVLLPEFLDEIVEEVRVSFQEKDFALLTEYPQGKDIPFLCVDKEKLRQAVVNLLKNAVEAVDVGGEVWVKILPEEGGEWCIEIFNTGSVIGEEERERIFDPFFTTKPRGTGLGLPIARELITSQGGRLVLESEPSKGVAFRIYLQGEPMNGRKSSDCG